MRVDQDNRAQDGKYRHIYAGTTTESELRKLAASGMSTAEIAESLQVSPGMLKNALCILGIKTRRKPRRNINGGTAPAWQKLGDVNPANNPFGLSHGKNCCPPSTGAATGAAVVFFNGDEHAAA